MVSYGITALIILCFVYSSSQTTLAQEVQSLSSQPEQRSETGSSQSVEFYVWGQQPTSAATEQTLSAKDLELRLPLETFAGFQSRFDHIRVGLFDQTKRRPSSDVIPARRSATIRFSKRIWDGLRNRRSSQLPGCELRS